MKYNYEFATETVEVEVNEEWEAALAEATALPKLKNHKSRTSLYIDGIMEFQVINLAYEYGDEIGGNKYAVASVHTEDKLNELYGNDLKEFKPFIYLTAEMGNAILESQRNDDYHRKATVRHHSIHEYDDETLPMYNKDVLELNALIYNPELANEDYENSLAFSQWKNDALESINKAMENLTDIQRRRFEKHIRGLTYREIANEENTQPSVIHDSVQVALQNIQKKVTD